MCNGSTFTWDTIHLDPQVGESFAAVATAASLQELLLAEYLAQGTTSHTLPKEMLGPPERLEAEGPSHKDRMATLGCLVGEDQRGPKQDF